MLKKCAALAAALAAVAVGTVAVTPVATGDLNSSERPGDRIWLEPQADAQDLFAFTTQDGTLITASSWIPLQSPAGGPYFGKLDPAVTYYTSATYQNLNFVQSYDLEYG